MPAGRPAGAARPRAPAQGQQHQHRVGPQVGQKPQVVPGGQHQAFAGVAEAAVGAEVQAQELGVAAAVAELFAHLQPGLRRHDQRHARQQRQQQPLRALAGQAGPAQHQPGGQAGDDEQQPHAPGVGQPHQRFERGIGGALLDVEMPGHVQHAHVVQHQQRKGGDAQPVDEILPLARRGQGVHGGSVGGRAAPIQRPGTKRARGGVKRTAAADRRRQGASAASTSPRPMTASFIVVMSSGTARPAAAPHARRGCT